MGGSSRLYCPIIQDVGEKANLFLQIAAGKGMRF